MRSLLNVRLAERRMSKKVLAERMGVTPMTVWRWSTDEGIGRMSLASLVRLAQAVGCDVSELFET